MGEAVAKGAFGMKAEEHAPPPTACGTSASGAPAPGTIACVCFGTTVAACAAPEKAPRPRDGAIRGAGATTMPPRSEALSPAASAGIDWDATRLGVVAQELAAAFNDAVAMPFGTGKLACPGAPKPGRMRFGIGNCAFLAPVVGLTATSAVVPFWPSLRDAVAFGAAVGAQGDALPCCAEGCFAHVDPSVRHHVASPHCCGVPQPPAADLGGNGAWPECSGGRPPAL
mmetsp:Transcript_103880/g.292987  ORF Transcript_103880/g.292987 Transcript_103880/m.292987 type:complete len:227 (-) Transcript_103880:295-975(-)